MLLDAHMDGDKEFQKAMGRLASNTPQAVYNMVRNGCLLIEVRAKTHHLAGATLKPRTHRLQASVKTRVTKEAGTVVGRVGSPVVYAAIHNEGGIIKPKNAKYLTFRINGKWISTKQVTMPKRPWLDNSVEDVKPQLEKIFGRELELTYERAG